jgi:hypothetical protein
MADFMCVGEDQQQGQTHQRQQIKCGVSHVALFTTNVSNWEIVVAASSHT